MVPWKWGGLGELWCPRRALPISPSAFGLAVASQRAPCTRERAAAAADSLASSPWRSRRSVPRRVALQGHGAPTPKRFGPPIPEHRHESVPNPKVSTPRMPSGPVREPPFRTSLPLPSGGAAEVPSRNAGDRSAAAGFVAQRERRREVGAHSRRGPTRLRRTASGSRKGRQKTNSPEQPSNAACWKGETGKRGSWFATRKLRRGGAR